jgi:hypothetical protein
MSFEPARHAHQAGAASRASALETARTEAAAELARRRSYNRTYMRRWRKDPHHRARERRRSSIALRRHQNAQTLHELRGGMKEFGKPLCAMCRHKPPVMIVERLRATMTGFLRVDLPYCGEC